MDDRVTLWCGGPCPNCPDATFEPEAVVLEEHGQSVRLERGALQALVAEARRRGLLPSEGAE